jgi:hypothetical protein
VRAPSLRKQSFCVTQRFSLWLFVILSALSLLNASVTRCQEKTGAIVVRVQLPDQSPIGEGVSVNLYNFSGAPVGTAITVGGRAGFENLPKASYSLEVMASGYERFTQSVEISSTGDQQFVYATLTPLAGSSLPL